MDTKEYQSHLATELSDRLEVCQLPPGGEDDWDRFVHASPAGTFFHLSGWKNVVEKVLGHRPYYLLARRGREISGVFPISCVRNKLFGDCLVSSPLAVYGGICASDEDSYQSLLKAGSELADRLGVRYLEMRNRAELYPTTLPLRDLYVTFVQDLTPGPDRLFKQLSWNTRHKLKKCLKSSLEWSEDVALPEFYEVYARNVHRLGTPVFSQNLFVQLQKTFPGCCRLFGVRKAGRLIAGVLCFYFKDQVLPYYAGSLDEFFKEYPNNFMYWKLIAQSCNEGYRCFDFGRSKRGTGSFAFKSGWSMQMIDLPYRYHLVRAKEVPHLSPIDSKFRLPVSMWQKLPFPITKVLGPRVIKLIPSV
jgi:FemAB-related protein (PEP-CTERM system-associated)